MKNGVRLAACGVRLATCGWRLAAGGWRRAVWGKGSKLNIQGKDLALFSQCLIVRDLQDLHDLQDLSPCPVLCALRPVPCALCSAPRALCPVLCALCSVPSPPCPVPYTIKTSSPLFTSPASTIAKAVSARVITRAFFQPYSFQSTEMVATQGT